MFIFGFLVIKLKIISFLLCVLLAIQILPVAQIGNMLGKNQWIEELPHDTSDDISKADVSAKFNHPYLPPADYTAALSSLSESTALACIHFSDQIPSNHSTEVVIPPPDSVF